MHSNGDNVRVIKRLDQNVVNRISAGEVIQRPVNVVKELMENSLDASSTSIQVMVKSGGMKSIVIEDNGSGIRKEDLELVCERFTTSKLEKFEDLQDMSTYGFRGEALSSISHVSYVTICTKTADQLCAYKLQFIDGKPKASATAVAATDGTAVTVENLFYNLLSRKKILTSETLEYNLILDMMTKYSIHNSNTVSFSLKKFGENKSDLNTSIGNKMVDNIRTLYGSKIGSNLIDLTLNDDERLKFSLSGFTSNSNIYLKNLIFILFINNRLVDCSHLKKAIDSNYSNHLMKGFHPFVYLSLKIDPKNIDVNVHPTKNEVHFLHEQEICEKIIILIESKLSDGEFRSLKSQEIHNSFSEEYNIIFDKKQNSNNSQSSLDMSFSNRNNLNDSMSTVRTSNDSNNRPKPTPKPNKQIRNDSKDRKMEEFLCRNSNNCKRTRRQIRLRSVLELRKSVADVNDSNLQDMICQSSYVGCADETLVLFQFKTKLMILNANNLNRELFYQLYLIDFGNFNEFQFSNPLSIHDLVKLYIDFKNQSSNENDSENSAKKVEQILFDNKEMLSDYFSITINDNKQLTTLPVILEGFVPNMSHLPQFIYGLAKVNWKSEKDCFEGIGHVLSEFYSKPRNKFETNEDHENWCKTVERVIYPAYKRILCPPNKLTNNLTFHMTAELSDLYKVFERC